MAKIDDVPTGTPVEDGAGTGADPRVLDLDAADEVFEAGGLVDVAGTRYSEKGTEMDVYAPTRAPLVVRVDPGGETT